MAWNMTVGELEQALFDAFPRADAESWDNPGLAVGDRSAAVQRVAVNLDMTAEAVIAAAEAGCNVLVTHHPPFIKEGPSEFAPQGSTVTSGPGRLVYEAASRKVSVIAMHTNADRALATRELYARMLGMECLGNFEHLMDSRRSAEGTGFGALLKAGEGTTLKALTAKARKTFGGCPRVWGSPQKAVRQVCVLNGSWGEPQVYDVCVAHGIDCAIVGETRYHFCVDAQPHLAVIDLGHDISELPIQNVLEGALLHMGFGKEQVVQLECSAGNWWTLDKE